MLFLNMFKTPYLDADTGDNGGGAAIETQSAETQATTTSTEVQQTVEQPKIKVKYNHQEMELPYEEAVTHIQKGMNYEKAVERARQEALDEYIAGQGYEWNGKKITTKAEYDQALKEKEIYDKYQAQGLPEEVIQKLAKVDQIESVLETEKRTRAEQEKKNAEYAEFFEYFKAENGRDFNSATDTIPQEVWDMAAKGKTLTDAYAYYANKQLKAKIAEYEAKLKAQETNQQNASSSPGSVTGNGSTQNNDFVSFEAFEANKHDQRWVIKNLSKINASRAKW